MTAGALVLRYAVTCSGECPACHVTVTVSGLDAERLPAAALGDTTAEPLKCLCGAEVPAVWVGFALAGFTVEPDDDDELEDA